MNSEVPNLRGGHFETLKMLASLISPLIAVGAVVWSAAQYPNRAEFKEYTKDVYDTKISIIIQGKTQETILKGQADQQQEIKEIKTAIKDLPEKVRRGR